MKVPRTLITLTLCLSFCQAALADPASIRTNSRKIGTLGQRIQILEQYVQFRRHYQKLEFDLFYQNNGGGGVPGPSDFDVRILAQVPHSELGQWRPSQGKAVATRLPDWVKGLPSNMPTKGLTEWYVQPGYEVGLDSRYNIVAFRRYTQ